MSVAPVALATADDRARTGALLLVRGRTTADRLIQTLTNAPVNHVGVAIVLEDMPPLIWHAEMGRSLTDVWTGRRQPGVQLHDLEAAVRQWTGPYGQRGWFRPSTPELGRAHEAALLECVARLDGVWRPSAGRLGARWVRGRRAAGGGLRPGGKGGDGEPERQRFGRPRRRPRQRAPPARRVEAAYGAEVVGTPREAAGILLPARDRSGC